MRTRSLRAVAVGAAAVVSGGLLAAPAHATGVIYYMYGYAGGSIIRAANSAITSDLSAESLVFTPKTGVQDTNSLASLEAQGVLSIGAISTSAKTAAIPGGRQVSVTASSAGVNLLNGLITASSVATTTTTKRVHGVISSSTHSSFTNLHIAGVDVPRKIPQNYSVKLGDIATVGINAGVISTSGGVGAAIGSGLRVTLLQPEGSANTGAEIDVNPTFTTIAPDQSPDTGHSTLGFAYATRILGAAGSTVTVRSEPTVPTTVFAQGTGGQTLTNSVAAVNLAPVGIIGAVRTTGVATNTTTVASVTMTSSVANVNLLGGLITATAIKVTAHSNLSKRSGSMTFTNLKIGGTVIPLNVAPNTVINLAIGKVTINQRIRSGNSITVRGLDIVLAQPTNGLPVGAEIQIAVAMAAAS